MPRLEEDNSSSPLAEDRRAEPASRPVHPMRARRWSRGRSARYVLLELATITAGVLIALSIESLREWRADRHLVREARATIAREIADNKRDVDDVIRDATKRHRNLATALQLANDLLDRGSSPVNRIHLGMSLADLSRAGWQSADRTGALTHMDYAEVQKYSRLYGLQELYEVRQQRVLDRLAAASAIFGQDDPLKAPRTDLESFRREVLALRAEVGLLEQFAERLSESCGEALKDGP